MSDTSDGGPAIERRADHHCTDHRCTGHRAMHRGRRSRRVAKEAVPDEGDLADRDFLTVEQAEQHSRQLGLPVAKGTLNKRRSVGGGPPFVRFGQRAILYPRLTFEAWLRERLTEPVRSTSEYAPGVIGGGRPRKSGARTAEGEATHSWD
jgi:hypothetical protein